ncbi:FecR family protein [Pedobacter sp. MW01-1-1]|uniref:FecR family protein n=1 Tax=Pedobacter sp. MW01-1-1 TaxID=3383027 RepID=UPI003FEED38E
MDNNDFRLLLEKYTSGLATEEEKARLESWYLSLNANEKEHLPLEILSEGRKSNWQAVESKLRKPSKRIWLSLSAAAAIVLVFIAGLYTYYIQLPQQEEKIAQKIEPGGNKAYLTLANGEKISLNDVNSGTLVDESGITIKKTNDAQLIYAMDASNKQDKVVEKSFNTVETPRGGQYQIILPDGTKVWLNAASSLKYPTTFLGESKRQVQLVGEAYFEVAHNKKQPFVVGIDGGKRAEKEQFIQVLGTHFNVNAYADQQYVRTTLLEGAVNVNDKFILKPGQQALANDQQVLVRNVDVDESIAWKEGAFIFNPEDFKSSLDMIARWYDVEFIYDYTPKNMHIGGKISRSRSISEVLEFIEATDNIKFKIEGRRIRVIK